MPGNRYLITGGAGFIGSHVAEALLRRGESVAIADNFDPFYQRARKTANLAEAGKAGGFQFYEADIRRPLVLRRVFQDSQPSVVIHLAARAGVRPSVRRPAIYESVNVAGTTNLLELARKFQVRKFVFISSSSVYGNESPAPFSEDSPVLRPVSPYAATKLAGEMICHVYSYLHGLAVVCLRLFSVYGPRQRPDLAICKFLPLLEQGKPLPVFGDGGTGRDYTYIDDIVAGILAAAAFDTKYEIFNLGNSHPVTTLEMIHLLEQATGKQARLQFLPPQPGDVALTWADVSKARRLLGYDPKIGLAEGLRKFLEWSRAERPRPAASIR